MHQIKYVSYTAKKTIQAIQKEANADCRKNGDYKQNASPIRTYGNVVGSYEEAIEFIAQNDKGWYDALAVYYKDGKNLRRLVKYEYHC